VSEANVSDLIARFALVVGLAAAVALNCSPALAQSAVIARIDGREVHCSASDEQRHQGCAEMLLGVARANAEEEFIVRHGLRATEAEVAELVAYNRAFEVHDRNQRARKLDDLETRLAASTDATERDRLARFRTVLIRLARYEADVDAGLEERVVAPAETLRRWIETFKLNAALYRVYGGTVGLNAAGPYAHGAKAALVADYVATHSVEFVDEEIARRFHAILAAPPRLTFTGGAPDFTPYWKRPIRASYIAD